MTDGLTGRKIAAGLFVSLDGVVEAPERWHFPYLNREMTAAVGRGRRLFPDGTAPVPLKLVRSVAFATGVLDLAYQPA
ncbi:hypothetical protein AB0L25_18645 [Spirillospora sp. NPDC052242]